MKKSFNKFKFKKLNDLKKYLEKTYPHPNLLIGFYLKNFATSSMQTSNSNIISYSVFENHDGNLVWRTYRKSDTPETNDWDVDQTNFINKQFKIVPNKKDIPHHHINGTPQDNIMIRNHMIFEVIEDKNGDFILNTSPDGLVKCLINFEEKPKRNDEINIDDKKN